MEKKIKWSPKAKNDLQQILKYWIENNKSSSYSIKLNNLFSEAVIKISNNSLIGKISEIQNIRMKLVRDYWLFYEEVNNEIRILQITSTHQNPEKFYKDLQ